MLFDTHTLVWALMMPEKLSGKAKSMITSARTRSVSAASLYEIALKGQLGKWPEVSDIWHLDMNTRLQNIGIDVIPASGEIMQMAGAMDWPHRDPFDRIIVSTALIANKKLVSKDKTLDTLNQEDLCRIW